MYIVYMKERYCFSLVCTSIKGIKFLLSKGRCIKGGPTV